MNAPPPMGTFQPSMWGDTFSMFSLDDQVQEEYAEAIEELKQEVTSMLMGATSGILIILIDTVERLGLAYHFKTEIEEKLEEIYNSHEDYDLCTTALRFRLLRQHQYHISSNSFRYMVAETLKFKVVMKKLLSQKLKWKKVEIVKMKEYILERNHIRKLHIGVFKKYLDENSKYKESLSDDVEGLLSLYEAAQALIHGEDILEEASAFTLHHLTRMAPLLQSPLLKHKVERALEQCLQRGIPIINARYYISIYAKDVARDEQLLKLAKFNFNFLQNMYKMELSQLLRWWNKFDLKSKLPYARDRMVECYIWALAFGFEPHYSSVRIVAAKAVKLVTIIDDTYDNYATLKDAQLLTETLERWDTDEIDGTLSDCMKVVYQFIMSIYEDYKCEAAKQEKSFAVPYFRESVKQLGKAYTQELKWLMDSHVPSYEEYFANSMITSCVYVILTTILPCIKSVDKKTIDWFFNEPKIAIATAMIGRVYNNLGSHERENVGGKMMTMRDCYTKYYGLSDSDSEPSLSKMVSVVEECWKDLNTEKLSETNVPKEMVELFFGYSKAAEVTYKKGKDGFTNPDKILAPQIIALLKDLILID